MNAKRLRLVLLGLIGLSVVLFFAICFLGLSKLSAQSQKMVSLKLQSKVLDYQLTSLVQAKKQVQQVYSYINSVASEVIPNDKDQAQAVLEINQIAQQSGIAIGSISFPASSLGGATVAGASAAGASTSSLISQARPVPGINGLYAIQLTITPQTGTQLPPEQQVTYAKMLDFLSRIEKNQRTAQITQVTVDPIGAGTGGAASSISFTITVNIFIKP